MVIHHLALAITVAMVAGAACSSDEAGDGAGDSSADRGFQTSTAPPIGSTVPAKTLSLVDRFGLTDVKTLAIPAAVQEALGGSVRPVSSFGPRSAPIGGCLEGRDEAAPVAVVGGTLSDTEAIFYFEPDEGLINHGCNDAVDQGRVKRCLSFGYPGPASTLEQRGADPSSCPGAGGEAGRTAFATVAPTSSPAFVAVRRTSGWDAYAVGASEAIRVSFDVSDVEDEFGFADSRFRFEISELSARGDVLASRTIDTYVAG